jgi:hypothetical protein
MFIPAPPSFALHARNITYLNVVGHVIRKMDRNKINWGLSIVVFITIVSFVWTSFNDVEERYFQYGKEFNSSRDSLGIPLIEEHWITRESNEWRRSWGSSHRGIGTIHPIHLRKTSTFHGETLVSEEDSFHYETDDSLAFRVVYEYKFDNGTWDCEFIRYRKGKYPPTSSWPLTLEQADSVLDKWELSR